MRHHFFRTACLILLLLPLNALSADVKSGDFARVIDKNNRVYSGKFNSLISDTLHLLALSDAELKIPINDISEFYRHRDRTLEFTRFGLATGVLFVTFGSLYQYYSNDKSGDRLSQWWKDNWLLNMGIVAGCGALGAGVEFLRGHYEKMPVNKIAANPSLGFDSGKPRFVLQLTFKI